MFRKEERGSILVLVLVIVAVLFITGIALAGAASTNLVQAVRQEKKTQAFLLARSGAEATAAYLIDHPEEAETLINSGEGTGSLDHGSFAVAVEPLEEGNLLINSCGTYEGVTIKISLELLRTSVELEVPHFDRAVFSTTNLLIPDKNKSKVFGDVESKGTIDGNPESGYHKYPNSKRVYPSPSFPNDISATADELTVKNHEFDTITSDRYLKKLAVDNHGTLYIDTTVYDVIRLVVEDVHIKGSLQIQGGGRLLLYVLNKAELQTPHSSTAGGALIIFVQDGKSLETIAHSEMNAYVYAPNATVGVQSHSKVYGAIICNRLVNTVASGQGFLGEIKHLPLDESVIESLAPYLATTYRYTPGLWSE